MEFREIQNIGGKARLINNAVQRLSSPPTNETVCFILPPAEPYTARVFKVIVPSYKGCTPPAFRFYPSNGEKIDIVPDISYGGVEGLIPIYGENAYVFHEIKPGTLMVYRDSAYKKVVDPSGGGDGGGGGGGGDSDSGSSEEEGDDVMSTEYGIVNPDGTLTIVNGVVVDPTTGSITFGDHTMPEGSLPVDRSWTPAPEEGYVAVPVANKWKTDEDLGIIIPDYVWMPSTISPDEPGASFGTTLPFFVRRKKEGFNSYIIYLPANCLKYDGEFLTIENATQYQDNWFSCATLGIGSNWCVITQKNKDTVSAKIMKGTAASIAAEDNLLTFFKIAEIEGTGEGLYDGIIQVAGGQENSLPDDLADLKPSGGSIGSGDTKVPFLVYADDSEEDGDAYMYIPEDSLTIANQKVAFEDVTNSRFPVEDDTSYWCEIFKIIGTGIDDDWDSEESSEESSEEDGIRYAARITSDEEPSNDVVLRFKITDVIKGENCNQKVFGAVTLGQMPDYQHLVAWQVVQIPYEDSKSSKKLYRMFLPNKGTIFYNGFSLEIKEAKGDWYELDEDIGTVNSTHRYYCVIYNLTAHVFTEKEYNSFTTKHLGDTAGIQAQFLAVEVKTGNGGDDIDPDDDWANKTAKALIVTTENGYFNGAAHARPGGNADFRMWSSVFSNMTSVDSILHLADGQAQMNTILQSLDMVCETSGLTIFMISTHGGPNGEMEVYNDLLLPGTLAVKFAQSLGPVWFIADCCYSGRAVANASPGSQRLATKLVTDIGEYLKANAPTVPYLGWACTQPDTVGWTMEDGSHFTKSCFRNISAGRTFAEVWTAVSSDPSVTSAEIPTKVVVNGFNENVAIIGAPRAQ